MEKAANINPSNAELSKPRDAQWSDTVVRLLTRCALHYRQELTEIDLEIYLNALRPFEAYRIRGALDKCFTECEFMPKLKDILERMPDAHFENQKPDLKVVREWDEPYNDTTVTHFVEYESGYRQAKLVRR